MSTDIGALQKQYDKLRQKQHHACVVISGIKHGKYDTDVNIDVDSPGSPVMAAPPGENDNVEDSVAMLTLSVPIVTGNGQQDLIDPVPPTVFGDTKCFFIQNVKKKKNKRSKRKNGSIKSEVLDADGTKILEKAESTVSVKSDTYPEEIEENNNDKKVKKVTFVEEVDIITEPKAEKDHLEDGNPDRHVAVQNDTKVQKMGNDHDAANKQVENGVDVGKCVDLENGTEVDNDVAETNKVSMHKYEVNDGEKTELGISSVGFESDKPFEEVEQNEAALDDENKEKSQENENQHSQQPENHSGVPKSVKNAPVKLPASLLKNSRTQGLRNPAVGFSKQYYPSGHMSHKKKRTSSESVESSNRQSIYQHFMMTKRQLSLDSALSSENNQAIPTRSIEFPFPVHSINEHKIKAGMKLGLYDQKVLEKIEKTRKLHKSKLPSLSYD